MQQSQKLYEVFLNLEIMIDRCKVILDNRGNKAEPGAKDPVRKNEGRDETVRSFPLVFAHG
jgi:hypothetical protein